MYYVNKISVIVEIEVPTLFVVVIQNSIESGSLRLDDKLHLTIWIASE